MSIIDKIESITASRNTIRTKMVTAGQATRTDKLATLATNLSITDTSDATATAADIAEGKTAYVEGTKITGTSTKDADTSDATATANDILTGKTAYAGGVKLTGTATAGIDTSDATAVAGDILSGKTAYVDGAKVSGTITSKSAQTYTPGTAAQTIAAGQYLSGAQTIAGDADLVASNIKKDVSIFGVTGTYQGTDTSDATATADKIFKGYTAYVNGFKVTGTYNPYSLKSFSGAIDTEITQMLEWCRNGIISYDDLVEAGWIVGAERPVSLSAMAATGVGESHVAQNQTWVILHGKDFFDLADGGKNLFVVGLKNFLANGTTREGGYMNSSKTNSGGWNNCARRTWCNNIFKNAIPSEELNWFKQFKVKASNGDRSSSVTESTDWFTLPSRAEVFGGSNICTPDAEGTTALNYYTDTTHRVKTAGDSGNPNTWWLRSPDGTSQTVFCLVNGGGEFTGSGASYSEGLAPFGCL